ncbi:MAG TPA: hypothetical protein DCG75_18900 [Bacteroidales bacterium]|nr:hypothetical protein [Bacteroidales bacterium]
MTNDKQVCSRCNETKVFSMFNTDNKRPNGKTAMCKSCIAVHHQNSKKIGQFIRQRKLLLWDGKKFPEINTESKARTYGKVKIFELVVVDQVKKLFKE